MRMRFPAVGAAVALIALAGVTSLAAGARPGIAPAFEQIVFIDRVPEPFHGGPPPHVATDAATDFHLDQGGLRWFGTPTVKYSVSPSGCSSDCANAVAQVNAGLDAWEVSGVTFTQDTTGDANPCGGTNSISWTGIDGAGGILAAASVCRNVATKEIVGFTIVFDSGDTWSDSGESEKFDIAATAAHEGGHAVGPGHAHAPRAAQLTMYFAGEEGDSGPRTLGCGDRLAVNALYGTSLTCSVLPGD